MLSRRWNGVELINSDTALELARRVHAASYGAAHLAANEPSDKGDWPQLANCGLEARP